MSNNDNLMWIAAFISFAALFIYFTSHSMDYTPPKEVPAYLRGPILL